MTHPSIALPLPEELEILELLWCRKVASAKELFQVLATGHTVGYRLVKTRLTIMEAKGLVTRSPQHPFTYQATHSRRELQNLLLSHLAGTLFYNDMSRLLRVVLTHPQLEVDKRGYLERTPDLAARSIN